VIEDASEGWFPLSPNRSLRTSVLDVLHSHPGWYVVQLEPPIEVQEASADTRSGLRQRFYDRLFDPPPGFAGFLCC